MDLAVLQGRQAADSPFYMRKIWPFYGVMFFVLMLVT